MGIDPGLINTGFGIVSFTNNKVRTLDFGVITPSISDDLSVRLSTIYRDVCTVIESHKPDCVSIEEVFYSNNVKTTMKLGQARGAVLIAAAQSKIKIYEYSARKIKLSLTGNGNSHKDQVRYMVENKLNLNLKSQKTDASDALAAALCHEQQFRSFEI